MVDDGLSPEDARRRFFAVDRGGLLLVHRHRRMIQSKSQSSKGLRHAAVHHPSESVH
jgi:hypothetical protein